MNDLALLRAEIDKRRRDILGMPAVAKRAPKASRQDIVDQAQELDFERFARIRLACFEGSPIDLDLHAAEITLTLSKSRADGTTPQERAAGSNRNGV